MFSVCATFGQTNKYSKASSSCSLHTFDFSILTPCRPSYIPTIKCSRSKSFDYYNIHSFVKEIVLVSFHSFFITTHLLPS